MAKFYEEKVHKKYPKLKIFLVLVQIAIPAPALIWMFYTEASFGLIYAVTICSALLLVIMWQMRRYITQVKFTSNNFIRNHLLQAGFSKNIDATDIANLLSSHITGESTISGELNPNKVYEFDNDTFAKFAILILKHTVNYEYLHEKSKHFFIRVFSAILIVAVLFLLSGDFLFSSSEQVIYNQIAIAIFIVIFSSNIIETFVMHEIASKNLTKIKHDLMSLILKKDLNPFLYQVNIIYQFGKFTDTMQFAPEIYAWFSQLYRQDIEREWDSALRRINF